MARILMVLDHSYPPDIRVENEARSLSDAGFDVTVLAVGPDSRPPEDNSGPVRVVRASVPAWVRNKMRGLAGSVPVLTHYLSSRIRRLHATWPFDAIHAHDLYMVGGVLHAARRLGVKVVADLHENWVAAIRQYAWSTRFPGRLFVSPRGWDRLETAWLAEVDAVIVVIEEMAERLAARGVPPERTSVVANTIYRKGFDTWSRNEEIVASMKSELTLLYTGGMDRHRGIEAAIRAMPEILRSVPGALLVLVGDGSVRGELELLADSLKLEDRVQFRGWQPQSSIPSWIAGADVGLIPHLKSDHTDHTIPHKLFHYMYMGLPVVTTNCRPLERIVTEASAGLVVSSGDDASLARAVEELAGDPDLRSNLGRNGRRVVDERFNWERSAEALIALYERLFD